MPFIGAMTETMTMSMMCDILGDSRAGLYREHVICLHIGQDRCISADNSRNSTSARCTSWYSWLRSPCHVVANFTNLRNSGILISSSNFHLFWMLQYPDTIFKLCRLNNESAMMMCRKPTCHRSCIF